MIKQLAEETPHEKFKTVKRELGLNNQDIANIVEQIEGSKYRIKCET